MAPTALEQYGRGDDAAGTATEWAAATIS